MSIFTKVKTSRANTKRSKFNLSHEVKMTGEMGNLMPILVEEVVPGDKFRMNTELLIKFSPLIAPLFHKVNAYVHYFFVPNRLTFDGWEKFITGGDDGMDATAFPLIGPQAAHIDYIKPRTLWDYMGLPTIDRQETTFTNILSVNALPFRAYQMIYNEYYRDENIAPEIEFGLGETVDNAEIPDLLTLRKRAWKKDYFTSALPWPQKGNPVSVPISGTITQNLASPARAIDTGGNLADGMNLELGAGSGNLRDIQADDGSGSTAPIQIDAIESLDLAAAGIDINDLRNSSRLQRWLERNARSGSRYIESILAHFNIRVPDYRLQRPEFLGGGVVPVQVSELNSTFGTDQSPQGNPAGKAMAYGMSPFAKRSFNEHGFIIGILSIMPVPAYMQASRKFWHKNDKFDFYWPEFAHLGEQEVVNKELNFDYLDDAASNNGVFGYQSRYAEYKFAHDRIAGDFKDTMAFWHMARDFTGNPGLNQNFLYENPTQRIYAVVHDEQGDPVDFNHLWIQLYNHVKAYRPMPYFSVPTPI